jgi:hypothetical protein
MIVYVAISFNDARLAQGDFSIAKQDSDSYTSRMAATVIQNQFVEYSFDSSYTTDANGRFQLTGNVTNIYRQVSISVATKGPIGVALTMHVAMTSIYGFSDVGTFPNGDGLIHTFPVVGSQFILYATGALPSVLIQMHGWVFIN